MNASEMQRSPPMLNELLSIILFIFVTASHNDVIISIYWFNTFKNEHLAFNRFDSHRKRQVLFKEKIHSSEPK